MARGLLRRLSGPGGGGRAWSCLATLLAAGAFADAFWPAHDALAWRPAAWHQPWRWWSAAWVHFSDRHLAANLAGTLVVGALGLAARLPRRSTLAWALAWPLTHLALLARPDLVLYGGLSGVLHAGVAAAVVPLLRRPGRDRAVGAAVLAGLLVKLALERPWGPATLRADGWDIALAPAAHAAGAAAGLLCAVLAEAARGAFSAPTPGGAHSPG
ncbi:rhombosortase [Aquabacterium sp. J223]|uniref:rhombosortase n=1 Tax=Aquabacterium sp. J223 TaxID=2898431 RepID=UPI0021AD8780|nr:rhombosortase [Aquabacterium sp. J223]UUX95904.1 rhombosortase [Aquabacterium sp. J223]